MRFGLFAPLMPVVLFLFGVGVLLGAPDAHGVVGVAAIAAAVLTAR